MKKSTQMFLSMAVSLIIVLISCSKENHNTSNSGINQTSSGLADTPYRSNNNLVDDTPYRKIVNGFADTPYRSTNNVVGDTPYLKRITASAIADTPYLRK